MGAGVSRAPKPIYSIKNAMNGNTFKTFYINLKHRTDRKQEMENEFQKMNITPYERFDAIKNSFGALGCSQSHIQCVKLGMASGAEHVVIFEDDFQFLITPSEYTKLLNLLQQIDYDVLLLGYRVDNDFHISPTSHPLLRKIRDSQTTSGYIVNKKYLPTLLENFTEGATLLERSRKAKRHAIDVHWMWLQASGKWFCYFKRVGIQRESYSDIEKGQRMYNV